MASGSCMLGEEMPTRVIKSHLTRAQREICHQLQQRQDFTCCIFLNFHVSLNSVQLNFVVEKMPCVEQGSSRNLLGPTFNKHKYPFGKIQPYGNGAAGVLHLQDLLQAEMTGMLLMGYLARKSHTRRVPYFIPGAQ